MTTRVVFGYPDGQLPNPTFRAYKRARRAIRSRGLDVQVELLPFGSLPEKVDVLLAEGPVDGRIPPGTRIRWTVLVEPERAAAEAERHLDELVTRGELGHAPPPARTIAIHRGVEPIAERARVGDAR